MTSWGSRIWRRTGTNAYSLGDDTRSWFEQRPTVSLRMLDEAGAAR